MALHLSIPADITRLVHVWPLLMVSFGRVYTQRWHEHCQAPGGREWRYSNRKTDRDRAQKGIRNVDGGVIYTHSPRGQARQKPGQKKKKTRLEFLTGLKRRELQVSFQWSLSVSYISML